MSIRRRVFLSIAAGLLAAPAFATQQDPDEIDLWPSPPVAKDREDGAERTNRHGAISHISRPHLNVYRPRAPNGTAVVVIAGGDVRVEAGTERHPGLPLAAIDRRHRLRTRVPITPRRLRNLRNVRGWATSHAARALESILLWHEPKEDRHHGLFRRSPSGGDDAVRLDALLQPPVDAAGGLSARPDFADLLYPVPTMMPPCGHTRSRLEIVGRNPDEAQSAAYSVERLANAQSPPTFLAQAEDDPVSPIEISLMMSRALRSVGVDTQLHVFRTGGHGWGLGKPGTEVTAWLALFADWAGTRGFLD
jgi:pimeloyl-ACP methyl ester carboxylesterase